MQRIKLPGAHRVANNVFVTIHKVISANHTTALVVVFITCEKATTFDVIIVGFQVIGLARDLDAMKELSIKLSGERGKLYPYRCDMRIEAEILKAFAWIEKNLGAVSVLVNNAGLLQQTTLLGQVLYF